MQEKGWHFASSSENVSGNTGPDPLHPDYTHLRDIYFEQNPDYEGRFTVPTLYDKKTKRIVSNESAEIIRMMYTAFDDIVADEYKKVDLFPKELQGKIEEMNGWVYDDINNGVYKSGFATYVFLPSFSLSLSLCVFFFCQHLDAMDWGFANDWIHIQHRRSLHKSRNHALQISRPCGGRTRKIVNSVFAV